ncbi:MAG: STAS domain-containing protein [Acidimicrobiia bacterium]
MTSIPFDVSVDRRPSVAILRLAGEVDRHSQEQLDAAYAQSGDGGVVLDFSDVGYINSTGIAVIVGLLARARAAGRQVRAYGLSDHYRQIFQITRIADFMAIFDNETEAVSTG